MVIKNCEFLAFPKKIKAFSINPRGKMTQVLWLAQAKNKKPDFCGSLTSSLSSVGKKTTSFYKSISLFGDLELNKKIFA